MLKFVGGNVGVADVFRAHEDKTVALFDAFLVASHNADVRFGGRQALLLRLERLSR